MSAPPPPPPVYFRFGFDAFSLFLPWLPKQDVLVYQRPTIAKRYLTTWFIPDCLGTVPLASLIQIFIQTVSPSVQGVKLIRCENNSEYHTVRRVRALEAANGASGLRCGKEKISIKYGYSIELLVIQKCMFSLLPQNGDCFLKGVWQGVIFGGVHAGRIPTHARSGATRSVLPYTSTNRLLLSPFLCMSARFNQNPPSLLRTVRVPQSETPILGGSKPYYMASPEM